MGISNMLKVTFLFSLFCLSPLAHASSRLDLGDDIMKPMGKLMKQVSTDITDGTKNASTIGNIRKIEGYVDLALEVDPVTHELALIPDTENYKTESTLVGANLALMKYTGLLQSLKVTLLELELTATRANGGVCGKPCADKLKQLMELEDVGHSVFRDPDGRPANEK